MGANNKKNRLAFNFVKPLFKFFRVFNLQVWPRTLINPNSIDVVYSQALETSAQFISKNLRNALLFQERKEFWKFAINKISLKDSLICEFGVSYGKSMNFFIKQFQTNQEIHGFDSFLGLSEDFYGTTFATGSFSTNSRIPKFPSNVKLHVGWFEQTLPSFLTTYPGNFGFIHVDCDTYESTSFVLQTIASRITAGTILVFDEYHGFPNWERGEHLAWLEFASAYDKKYEYIAFAPQGAAIRVN